MTVQDYQPFLSRMIQRYEGFYGWNRNDPGGPTNMGVTCWDLAEHRHQSMDSMEHWASLVKAMSFNEAEDIYREKYATACAFVDLGAGKDCVVFDFGVNSGPSRSVKYSQIVVGVPVDGILGPVTISAINSYEPRAFINDLCNARLRFLRSLGNWSVFGTGWHARVEDLRAYSLALAFPPRMVPPVGYTDKLERIPLAFAKAYNGGDVPNQQ